MYKLSVVGTGRMGRGLVRVLSPLSKESDLIWGSRTPDKARALIDEEGFRNTVAGGYEEALGAEVILHSLWFRDVLPWAKENREALKGKILVDIANPFTEDFNDFTTEWGTSAAEELQKLLPHTRVVGAFKNTFFRVLEQPENNGLTSDVYVTGDDEEAKRTVLSLLDGIPFRVWTAGG